MSRQGRGAPPERTAVRARAGDEPKRERTARRKEIRRRKQDARRAANVKRRESGLATPWERAKAERQARRHPPK